MPICHCSLITIMHGYSLANGPRDSFGSWMLNRDGAKLKKNKLKGTKMSFWEDKNIFFGIFKDISPKTLVRPCPPRQLPVLQLPWKWKTTEVLQLVDCNLCRRASAGFTG